MIAAVHCNNDEDVKIDDDSSESEDGAEQFVWDSEGES